MLGLRDGASSAHQVDKWTFTSTSQAEVEGDVQYPHSHTQTHSALLGNLGTFEISLRRSDDSNADIPGRFQLLPSCEQQRSFLTIAELRFMIIRSLIAVSTGRHKILQSWLNTVHKLVFAQNVTQGCFISGKI